MDVLLLPDSEQGDFCLCGTFGIISSEGKSGIFSPKKMLI